MVGGRAVAYGHYPGHVRALLVGGGILAGILTAADLLELFATTVFGLGRDWYRLVAGVPMLPILFLADHYRRAWRRRTHALLHDLKEQLASLEQDEPPDSGEAEVTPPAL